MENTIGLAPKSPFWKGVRDSVYLADGLMSVSLCMFPGQETMSFDHLPKGHLIMVPVLVESESIAFPGKMKYSDLNGTDIERQATICVKNSKNKKFQALKMFNDLLISKLCVEPYNCNTVKDLNTFKEGDIALELDIEGKIINNASLKNGR